MKKLFVLFIGLALSCETKDTKEEIQEILEQQNYKIECKFQGCFGGGTERVEIKDNGIAIYTYLSLNDTTGSFEKTRQIPWDMGKQKLLKEIFESGINLRDTVGFCTTTSKYKLTNFIHSVEFEDMNCELTDKFADLLR
jgi:hypothetical protein